MATRVLVVDHANDIHAGRDYLIELAHVQDNHGGGALRKDTKSSLKLERSLANYINGIIPFLFQRKKKGNGKSLILKGAKGNNRKTWMQNYQWELILVPVSVGQSTLINETCIQSSKSCYDSKANPMEYKSIKGLEHIARN